MDKFDEIYNMQICLNKTITPWADPEYVKNLNEEEKFKLVSKYLDVLSVEVAEAKMACGCRWWKRKKDTSGGLDHLSEELVDILHFLLSSFIVIGKTPEDIYNEYKRKSQVNHIRPDWERS